MKNILSQKITNAVEIGVELPKISSSIKNNLNSKFELRPYQTEGFSRFLYYFNNPKLKQKPTQLLYHMATGSGKTLMMAGLILYLYERGYRNFLFFVNSTNIINKTKENFLNPASSKYLFSNKIEINNKEIRIREVENFQTETDDFNIVFSTIQGLHSNLNTPRENQVTYDDFSDKKIVLISDEAHHLNVDTKKKLSKAETEEKESWENTINRIFRSNPENILLEFTATAGLDDSNLFNKYFDKLIFDYPLKQFRIDKYSKEVKVLQADIENFPRALQACLLSQYRRKIFEKNSLIIKPTILFKSKTIKESQSFSVEFEEKMKNLSVKDIENLSRKASTPVLKEMFAYYKKHKISFENLINELKEDFSEDKCIEINSKDESIENQILVNTLEDTDNEIRIIFAVDKLNEGWDVLNLFDIVRLYNTRNSNTKTGKIGRTTIREAQLIGRGARYCPFVIENFESKYKRKFDEDIDNELRVCEELYYHSAYNPKYIHELNVALQKIGMRPKKAKEIQLTLKDEFKESNFYKTGFVFLNERIKFDRSDIFALPDSIVKRRFHHNLHSGLTLSSQIFDKEKPQSKNTVNQIFKLSYFNDRLLRKALSKLEFYQFYNLQAFLPNLKSISKFISSDKYLGNIEIEINGTEEQLQDITNQQKLEIVKEILNIISSNIVGDSVEFKGTKRFKPHNIKSKLRNKKLNIVINENGDQEFGISQKETYNQDLQIDLSKKDWFVFNDNFGTSEEKYLVKFINDTYDKLSEKYKNIYLIRNEKHFQIYNFKDGQPFEPDFVLFLEQKQEDNSRYYQVFIEPKGEHLRLKDKWKEDFLMALKKKHLIETLWETKEYTILGMPFFTQQLRTYGFDNEFNVLIK